MAESFNPQIILKYACRKRQKTGFKTLRASNICCDGAIKKWSSAMEYHVYGILFRI